MRTLLNFFAAGLALCLVTGCANPHDLLREGNIQRAYTVSKRQVDQRLKQQKPFRGAELDVLIASYTLLQEEQIRRVETLQSEREPDRWLALYPIYQQLLARRQEIEPYLPLYRQADPIYDLASLEALVENARQQSGAYCFGEAQKLFSAARSGDKPAARTAHHWLGRSLGYVPESSENVSLQAEMLDLGTVRVLVSASEARYYEAGQLLRYLLSGREPERLGWLEIHYTDPYSRLDYLLPIEVTGVYVSFEGESSSCQTYSKEIIDGYTTVEKQVTSGDTTITVKEQVPIYITVYGSVTTVDQYKSASGDLYAQLMTPEGALVGDGWPVSGHNDWSNSYQICSGDSRAIPVTCFGFSWMHPSDREMIRGVSSALRRNLISDLRGIFPDSSGSSRRARR